MYAYHTKHSDRQIYIPPVPNEHYFTKFNAHQCYALCVTYLDAPSPPLVDGLYSNNRVNYTGQISAKI